MSGIFYGVSVGPGDPELLTLKAVRIIKECAVIAAPKTEGGNMLALSIAGKAVDLSGKEIVPLELPMTRDREKLKKSRKETAELIAGYLERGEDVAMLCLGDISVYSTCSYISDELAEMGFATCVCAGVTSFCAAADAVGISLAEGSEPLTVIPAKCAETEELLSRRGTKVIMKSGRNSSEVIRMLRDKGLEDRVIAVENCGLPGERICKGVDGLEDCGYFTVMIVTD